MPAEWRSGEAQTFVGGRITKIDGYWRAAQISGGLVRLIDEWDLWGVAFGPAATNMKKDWKTYTHGEGLLKGLASKAAKTVGAGSARELGTEIWNTLEQRVTMPLQQLLRATPLTINFNSNSWFKTQAGFDEYISMWDRKQTDASLNANVDPKNPAHVRAKADRWALYGQFPDGKRDTRDAGLELAHVKKHGGVTSAATWSHSSGSPGKTPKPIVSDSQVFAALNYGRRPHGSNTEYGMSFFELSDDFKGDAIYFAMDTFTPISTGSGYKTKDQRSKLYQVSAGSFAGSILLAIKSQYDGNPSPTNKQNSIALIEDLLDSAHTGMSRPDNNQNHMLIEAHLFQKVLMQPEFVVRANVSRSESAADKAAVKANMDSFHQRTGVSVKFID